MNSAYQNFLDFFSLTGRERLDGLTQSYFEGMTSEEREHAFDYLLTKVRAGGSAESIHGLFRADPKLATNVTRDLLEQGSLRPEAEIAAAWNIYQIEQDKKLISVFAKYLHDSDKELRGMAAYYAPSNAPTTELLDGLKGMILTEVEKLPLIHATNKLLQCYGISENVPQKSTYVEYYRGLRSESLDTKKKTFLKLEKNFPISKN